MRSNQNITDGQYKFYLGLVRNLKIEGEMHEDRDNERLKLIRKFMSFMRLDSLDFSAEIILERTFKHRPKNRDLTILDSLTLEQASFLIQT